MFFDNSLLKDHTGYILAIIVVFLQSAHLEKDEAVGFSVVVFLFLNETVISICLQTNQPTQPFRSYLSELQAPDLKISLGTKDCFLPSPLLDSVGWELSARGTKRCVWVFCCDHHSAKIPSFAEDSCAFWNRTTSEQMNGCRRFPNRPTVWVTRALHLLRVGSLHPAEPRWKSLSFIFGPYPDLTC